MSKHITKDDDGLFNITMDQAEILLLCAGVIPYLIYDNDPMIPDNEFLWVHQEEKLTDTFPALDPFPCTVISSIQVHPDLFILTLIPDEIDLEFLEFVEDFKVRMKRKSSTNVGVLNFSSRVTSIK